MVNITRDRTTLFTDCQLLSAWSAKGCTHVALSKIKADRQQSGKTCQKRSVSYRPVADISWVGHNRAMKTVATVLLFGGAAAAAGFAASVDSGMVHREVAGHRFEIPKDLLFDATIPWLPLPEKDSFIFVLRPNHDPARIPDHRFLVEPLTRHCPGDASQMLRITCGLEKTNIGDGPPYQKRQSESGSWASDLFSIRRMPSGSPDQRRQIAYCQRFEPNLAKPKGTTLCTTFWAYKGMMLQFSFDEKELPSMLTMKRDAMRLLDIWAVN